MIKELRKPKQEISLKQKLITETEPDSKTKSAKPTVNYRIVTHSLETDVVLIHQKYNNIKEKNERYSKTLEELRKNTLIKLNKLDILNKELLQHELEFDSQKNLIGKKMAEKRIRLLV